MPITQCGPTTTTKKSRFSPILWKVWVSLVFYLKSKESLTQCCACCADGASVGKARSDRSSSGPPRGSRWRRRRRRWWRWWWCCCRRFARLWFRRLDETMFFVLSSLLSYSFSLFSLLYVSPFLSTSSSSLSSSLLSFVLFLFFSSSCLLPALERANHPSLC